MSCFPYPQWKPDGAALRCKHGLLALTGAAILAFAGLPAHASAPPITFIPTVQSIAGNGTNADTGDNGPALQASVGTPAAALMDGAGNLYLSDSTNCVVRRVDHLTGLITTVAGDGTCGYSGDSGPATHAELNHPMGLAFDPAGDLVIADANNFRIRYVNEAGKIFSLAGNGGNKWTGDGGLAMNAEIGSPWGIAIDAEGNLYFTDSLNGALRRIDASTKDISALAGVNTSLVKPITSTPAGTLTLPSGVAVDTAGNIYFSEGNHVRCYSTSTNTLAIVAGTGTAGFSGDGGQAASARLSTPQGLSLDGSGSLMIADHGNARIRKLSLSTGVITTIAGTGSATHYVDGLATIAASLAPFNVSAGQGGELMVADSANSRILRIGIASHFGLTPLNTTAESFLAFEATGVVENLSATVATNVPSTPLTGFYSIPQKIGCSNGEAGATIAFLEPGTWCSLAVTFAPTQQGILPGTLKIATSASGNTPATHALDGEGAQSVGSFLPSNGLALVTPQSVSTTAYPNFAPFGVSSDAFGNLFVADAPDGVVFVVSAAGSSPNQGQTTLGGTAVQVLPGPGSSPTSAPGDNGLATNATLLYPYAVAQDRADNLYISDLLDARIRRVTFPGANIQSGVITTFAGTGTPGYSGDGGPATQAEIGFPAGIAFDSNGNLFFADMDDQVVRKIDVRGIITTVAGNGASGYAGDGGPATAAELNYPSGVAVDDLGNLYIADTGNNVIRRVTPSGLIGTFAGTGSEGAGGDGIPALSCDLNGPMAVASDPSGAVYIGDTGNGLVRKVDLEGNISTVYTLAPGKSAFPSQTANDLPMISPLGLLISRGTGANLGAGQASAIYVADAAASTLWTIQPGLTSINVDDASDPVDLQVTNTGNLPLLMQPPTKLPVGVGLGGNCNLGEPLPVGASCNLQFSYFPASSTATLPASVVLPSNAANGPLTVTLNETRAAVSLSLAASPNPATVGSPATISPLLSANVSSAPAPTGQLSYSYSLSSNGTPVTGTVTLPNASFTIPVPSGGTYSITVTYSGDAYYGPATASLQLPVGPAQPTLVVSAGSNPTTTASASDTITFSFANFISSLPPTGTITYSFFAQGVRPVNGRTSAASPTFTLPGLAAGVYTINANYLGDSNYDAASGQLTLTVNTSTPSVIISGIPVNVTTSTPVTIDVAVLTATLAPGQSVVPVTGKTTIGISPSGLAPTILYSFTGASGSYKISAPVAGTYNISANFGGDSNYNSASATTSFTVAKQTTTLTATAATNPVAAGTSDKITFALGGTVTGKSPTGTFSYSYTVPGALTAITGTVTLPADSLTLTSPVAGSYNLTVTYSGDSTYASSQTTYALVVNKITPTLTVTSYNVPTSFGESGAVFYFHLGGVSTSPAPTGNITWSYAIDNPNIVPAAPAVTGSVDLTSTYLVKLGQTVGGTYKITANYAGDANYAPATGFIKFQIALQLVRLSGTLNTLPPGYTPTERTIDFTLSNTDSNFPPTGKIRYSYTLPGSTTTVIGSATVETERANIALNNLIPGSYSVSATYEGDYDNQQNSTTVTFTVGKATPALTANPANGSPSTSAVSDVVTSVFSGSLPYGAPTGTLSYSYTAPGASSATTGVVTLPAEEFTVANLVGGHYSIGVHYSGDAKYNAVSATTTLNVSKAKPTITIGAVADPAITNQSDSITVGLSQPVAGVAPTGTITYSYIKVGALPSTQKTGTFTLPATGFTLPGLPVGIYEINAIYSGDAHYAASTRSILLIVSLPL